MENVVAQYLSFFPHMANCVDDFCLIKSMHTDGCGTRTGDTLFAYRCNKFDSAQRRVLGHIRVRD